MMWVSFCSTATLLFSIKKQPRNYYYYPRCSGKNPFRASKAHSAVNSAQHAKLSFIIILLTLCCKQKANLGLVCVFAAHGKMIMSWKKMVVKKWGKSVHQHRSYALFWLWRNFCVERGATFVLIAFEAQHLLGLGLGCNILFDCGAIFHAQESGQIILNEQEVFSSFDWLNIICRLLQ